MDKRPELNKNININDFKEYYWLKEELIAFCKQEDLNRQGDKKTIAQRIEHYLKTGEEIKLCPQTLSISRFNWNKEPLSLNTIITDNYKNTENVRAFFTKHIGSHFKFNVPFMNWMKTHQGETMGNAINEWLKIEQERKSNKKPKLIDPQFEYNRYIRDFLADNPKSTIKDAIKLWKIKKSFKGDNAYKKTDLLFTDKNI